MDIVGLAMNMKAVDTMSKIGTAVLSKELDTNEMLGEGMVQIMDSAAMERSVNPAVGGNFDMSI